MAGYYFRLPAITQLTIPQQAALNEPKQIALSGGPGTGKSVVSLWRHIRNYQKKPVVPRIASFLSTYTTTLKVYLTACCKTTRDDDYPNAWLYSSQNVGTSLKNLNKIQKTNFLEVIIDEAQDLSNDYYTNIASPVSYGADDSQILYPEHCSKQSELCNLFPNNVMYVLDKNFRSTQRIMQFSKYAFPNANIPISIIQGLDNNIGEKPVLLISNRNKYDRTNDNQDSAIEKIINDFRADDHNIAILVPWQSDVKAFEKVLDKIGLVKEKDYSSYCGDDYSNGQGCGNLLNIHITTFKSAKGLEFDTVIIPNFHKYYEICGKFNVDWQDYYVACTRARSNLYLISNNDLPQLHDVVDCENIDNQNKTNNQSFTNNYGNSRGTSNNTITIINDDLPF